MSLRTRAIFLAALLISSCGFVHDEQIDGPYRLVAIDVDEEMDVCYEVQDACVGRIPATVYEVGSDAKYIVAARHPSHDRATSEYYYLIRAFDSPNAEPGASVRGPFDSVAFDAERAKLNLPPLTRVVSSVK
jgi:hypothetical protein